MAAAVAAFSLGLRNELFGDDLHLLVRRLGGLGLGDVPSLFGQGWWGELAQARHYRPLVLGFLGVERVGFGDAVLPYHAVSLALHAACSVLVWRVLERLGFAAAALGAALLFAVHPIHAEAVLPAYGQADLLAALATLLSLERYVAFSRGQAGRGALAASYLCFLLGLGCKESAAVLPALVVLTRGLLLRPEARGVGRWLGAAELGYALPLLAYLGVRFAVLGRLVPASEVTVSHGFPLALRVKTVLVSLAHDVRLAVLPTDQTIRHTGLSRRLAGSGTLEATWLALAMLGLALSTRVLPPRRVAWAVGWFAVSVAPVAGIVPLPVLVSERNLYLPALAPVLLVALLLERLRADAPRLARALLVALVLTGLAASVRVTWTWRNPVSLWQEAVRIYPGDPLMWVWLGGAWVRRAEAAGSVADPSALAEARAAYDRALALHPDVVEAQVGRAGVAFLEGDCATALGLLEALPDASAGAGPHVGRGWFLEQRRRCSER